MSTNKMSQDAKKEEFKKYLEKAGVLEVLTKSLVSLYEEPDKPGDAVNYLKKSVGGTDTDKVEIDRLQSENAELKSKVSRLTLLGVGCFNCLFPDRCYGGEECRHGGQAGWAREDLRRRGH